MSRRFCTCVPMEGLGRLAMMVTGALMLGALAFAAPARAETDSHRQEGVTLRLVALPPDAEGRLHGALAIELEPGWKTYWIAPGPVGLAPQVDLSRSSGIAGSAIAFPVPGRFREGEAQSVGYGEPIAVAIEAAATDASPVLRAGVLIGVCRELCVPVQADLAAEPTRSLSDRALVARSEAAVPTTDGPLAARRARWNEDGTALQFEVASDGDAKPLDAFASSGDGWSFGEPVLRVDGGSSIVALPVLARPAGGALPLSVDLLLTRGESAQLSRAVPIAPR